MATPSTPSSFMLHTSNLRSHSPSTPFAHLRTFPHSYNTKKKMAALLTFLLHSSSLPHSLRLIPPSAHTSLCSSLKRRGFGNSGDCYGDEVEDKDEDKEEEEDVSSLKRYRIEKDGYGDKGDGGGEEEEDGDGFDGDVTAAGEDRKLLESPYIKAFHGLHAIDSLGPSLQQGIIISIRNNEDEDEDEEGYDENGIITEEDGKLLESPYIKAFHGRHAIDSVGPSLQCQDTIISTHNNEKDEDRVGEDDEEEGYGGDATTMEQDRKLLKSPNIKTFCDLHTIDSVSPSLQQVIRISTHNNDDEEEEGFDEDVTTMEEDIESPYIKVFHGRHTIDSIGPSLHRGIRISTHNNDDEEAEEEEGASGRDATTAKEDEKLLENPYVKASHGQPLRLDRHAFSRTYMIPALRVPAAECSSMVARLRGHLLNWPRIGNVARVPGDDIDENLKKLLWNDAEEEEESPLNALRSAVYGVKALPEDDPWRVSQRMELAKKVGHFKVLARLSRPLRDRRDRKGQVKKGATKTKAGGRTHPPLYTVKVFDEAESATLPNAHCQGSVGTIGETLRMKPWPGPTRLLLLDEKHLGKHIFLLPMAIQVVLGNPKVELVECHLKICYEYWPVDEILRELLPAWMQIPTTFETIGHIAHLNLREEHLPYKHAIAQVILDKYQPRIKTVVNKTESIKNQFRTKQLEVLAGNHSLVTSLIEHGIRYHINLATVYWSSRLATERQRLIQLFQDSDIVCDIFAGVGPITVAAAKKVRRVVANDLNPEALVYLSKNISQNNLQAKVELFNMDGREFIRKILSFQKPVLITQVVMNLPTNAIEFLDAFIGAFNKDSWGERRSLPMIHVYGFSKAADPEGEIKERILQVIKYAPDEYSTHRVRLVAPGKWMICASFRLPHIIAFQTCSQEASS